MPQREVVDGPLDSHAGAPQRPDDPCVLVGASTNTKFVGRRLAITAVQAS
jgi:hypothetical protein